MTALFPHRDTQVFYDMGNDEDTEWLVDDIIGHRWTAGKLQFHVKWNLGDTTWEPYSECKDLEAVDNYLDLMGVTSWRSLPRVPRKKAE